MLEHGIYHLFLWYHSYYTVKYKILLLHCIKYGKGYKVIHCTAEHYPVLHKIWLEQWTTVQCNQAVSVAPKGAEAANDRPISVGPSYYGPVIEYVIISSQKDTPIFGSISEAHIVIPIIT